MPPLAEAEREEFLETPGVLMRVATVDPEGNPHVAPIWFIYEDGRLWFTPRAASDWLRNIRVHPRVALVIDEEAAPYRKVTVTGDTQLVHDLGEDDVWRDRYRRIARRYVPETAAEAYVQNTIDQPRALLALTLKDAVVTTWRMPKRDESQTGMWHRRYYADGSRYAAEADSR